MNEPSNKAKAAAAIWEIPYLPEFYQLQLGPIIVAALREAYAQGHDAAVCPRCGHSNEWGKMMANE